jgi:carbon storage regulator
LLVITRRVGEKIVLGDDIRVTVVAILPDRARLGVMPLREVHVDRDEIHERRAP